jgi:Ricin-type beta-trefoil lectin domain
MRTAGTDTVGRHWTYVVILAITALTTPEATAQECRWDGTSPWCNGSCSDGETELTRMSGIPEHWEPPFVTVEPDFGANCGLGSKALCCTSSLSCRWDGTAPFCDGECRDDEVAGTPPEGSTSGQGCWSGSKKYCCKKGSAGGVPITFIRALKISNVRSAVGKCLDVHAPDQDVNGARVQVWDCANVPQQSWMLVDGVMRSHAGKCFDIHAPDMQVDGGRVQVWDCNGSPQQKWWLDGQTIRSVGGKCLDVHAPDQSANGGRVQVWACNGTQQQTWTVP